MKKILLIISSLSICISMLHIYSVKTTATGFDFSVETVTPYNQVNMAKTYFDLNMKPAQQQTLKINIRNDSKKEITLMPKITSATTNGNGIIEYGNMDVKSDTTLRHKMEDIISTEKQVVLSPHQNYTLQLKMHMPKEKFDGLLAGGIVLQQIHDKEEKGQEMADKNEYAYVIAILLSENDTKIRPGLKLNQVMIDQRNDCKIIRANIQNRISMCMYNMKIDAKIIHKGRNEVLYKENREGLQMAPNSNFDYSIPLQGKEITDGEYTLHLKVRAMGREWNWKKDFAISNSAANELKETDAGLKKNNSPIYIYMGITASVLFILSFILKRAGS